MSRLLFAIILSVGLLSGCALSPQTIHINPQAQATGPAYGQGRQISVQVEDKRASQILGTRGGVYDDTSTISINNDLAAAVQSTALDALQQLGFNGKSSAQPAQMLISIETLTYTTRQKSLMHIVDLETVLKVTTIIAGSVHEGSYQTQGQQEFSHPPEASKNASMINKLLSDTIDRAFSDPNLARFMLKH